MPTNNVWYPENDELAYRCPVCKEIWASEDAAFDFERECIICQDCGEKLELLPDPHAPKQLDLFPEAQP